MIVDSLPYFLKLVKSNIILSAMINTGSFTGLDLKGIEHSIITDSSIEFYNFSLSQKDVFERVTFFLTKDDEDQPGTLMSIIFITNDWKYFENTAFYFNEDEDVPIKKHPIAKQKRIKRKDIGFVKIFDPPIPPAHISVYRNSQYGYAISLDFYSNYRIIEERIKNLEAALFSKPNFR